MGAATPDTNVEKGVRHDALFLLLISVLALTIFTAPLFDGSLEAGFPLDDGWIHATYARNLAAQGEFAFNPGEPSTGTTSLLWTLLLATAYATGAGAAASAFVLSSACMLLLVFSWHRTLLHAGSGRAAAFFGAALLPLSGILEWWTLSGMETVLFLLLAVLALSAFSRGHTARSGAWLALLILARPEGILLAPVLAFAAWRRDRRFRPALALLSAAAAGIAVYVAWNLAVSGSLWTSTLAGRRWLASGGRPPESGIAEFATAFADILFRWLRTVLWGALRWSSTGTWIAAAAAGAVLLWTAFRALAERLRLRRLLRDGATPTTSAGSTARSEAGGRGIDGVLAFWLLLHTAAYAALLPYPGHAGRYLAPLMLGASLLLAHLLSLLRIRPAAAGPSARSNLAVLPLFVRVIVPRALLLSAAVLVGWSAVAAWSCTWRSSTEHINLVHRRAAAWLSAHTPPQSRIAAYDIGAIGYFSGRRVIDLGGLVQPAAAPFMDGDIDGYVLSSRADYVAMIAPSEGLGAPGSLPHALGYGRSGLLERRRVKEFHIPEKQYRRHISVTGNAYPRVIIEKTEKKPEKS